MITQKMLKELLEYDQNTGVFRYKKTQPHTTIKPGDIAGSKTSDGYLRITINYKEYRAHRLAWLYMEGFLPKNIMIDHINRNRSDNSWCNLRLVSPSCNTINSKLYTSNSSGIKGVSWCNTREKWVSIICINGKNKTIGRINSKIEAVEARWLHEVKYGFTNCLVSTSFEYLSKKIPNFIKKYPIPDELKKAFNQLKEVA